MIATLEAVMIGAALRVRFVMADNYSQYVRIVVDGIPQGPPFYAEAGTVYEVLAVPDYNVTKHTVSVCPQGDWPNADIHVDGQVQDFEADHANTISVSLTPSLEFFSSGDSGQLSSWTMTGIERFSNCKPVDLRPQWGKLAVTLTTSGGVRTLNLLLDSVVLATGTRTVAAGNGTITLSALNDSGLSGSVTLTYSGDIASGATFYAQFPYSYPIHYRTSSFSGGDFPRTAEMTVLDDGNSATFTGRTGELAAGTYYVVAHQKTDTGTESTNTDAGGAVAVIQGFPVAPTALAYSSGGYAATVVSFTASTTGGATYNVYDSGESEILDTETVTGTHIAGTGTLTQTLPAISAGFTGDRYVLVRAVNAGAEETNTSMLTIEYASGVRVAPRPNSPTVAQISTSGKTLTVKTSINTDDQKVAAATVKLFLFAVGGTPSYGSPDGSAAVNTAVTSTIHTSVAATAGSNGVYMYAIRSASAAGTQDANTDTYGPVELTTAVPSGPTAVVQVGA